MLFSATKFSHKVSLGPKLGFYYRVSLLSHRLPLSCKLPLSCQALFRVSPVVSQRTFGGCGRRRNLGTITARGSRDTPGRQAPWLSSQSQSSSATVMQIPWRGKKRIWWEGGGFYRQCQEVSCCGIFVWGMGVRFRSPV